MSSTTTVSYPKPLVLMFSIEEPELSQSCTELQGDGFEVEVLKDPASLPLRLKDPRSIGVVLGDNGVFDQLKLIQHNRAIGNARWILFSRKDKGLFRNQAYAFGAASVQAFPPRRGMITSETRRIFAEQRASFLNRVGTRSSDPRLDKYADMPTVTGSVDYRMRRRWPTFNNDFEQKALGPTTMSRIMAFDGVLKNLVKEINEAEIRFRLISFGVNGPHTQEVPQDFVVLSSNQTVFPQALVTPVKLYPEILGALKKRQTVYVPNVLSQELFSEYSKIINKAQFKDVAAIPLFDEDKIFGMFLMRFTMRASEGRLPFLKDFTSYCQDLSPFILDLDFLARVYRSNPQIIPMKRTAS